VIVGFPPLPLAKELNPGFPENPEVNGLGAAPKLPKPDGALKPVVDANDANDDFTSVVVEVVDAPPVEVAFRFEPKAPKGLLVDPVEGPSCPKGDEDFWANLLNAEDSKAL
jgi:hypothetical protein